MTFIGWGNKFGSWDGCRRHHVQQSRHGRVRSKIVGQVGSRCLSSAVQVPCHKEYLLRLATCICKTRNGGRVTYCIELHTK